MITKILRGKIFNQLKSQKERKITMFFKKKKSEFFKYNFHGKNIKILNQDWNMRMFCEGEPIDDDEIEWAISLEHKIKKDKVAGFVKKMTEKEIEDILHKWIEYNLVLFMGEELYNVMPKYKTYKTYEEADADETLFPARTTYIKYDYQIHKEIIVTKELVNEYRIFPKVDINLANNKIVIKKGAFSNCDMLVNIGTIRADEIVIEEGAFINCKNLEEVRYYGLAHIDIHKNAFINCPKAKLIDDVTKTEINFLGKEKIRY